MKRLIYFFILLFISCSAFGFAGPAPELQLRLNLPKDPDLPVIISIADIKAVPELEGRMVLLAGVFAGWEEIGVPPPFSRRDWVLRNDSGEIFVHGPYPEGCDPMDRDSIGSPIEIKGRIALRLVQHFGNPVRVVFINRKEEK